MTIYVGYDPGGNGKHGVAALVDGARPSVEIATLEHAGDVVRWIENRAPCAIGIDTLTCWSLGLSGWRRADLLLRAAYPEVVKSIASSNSLYGAMSVNGMATMIAVGERLPAIEITETLDLYWALTGETYDFKRSREAMDGWLAEQIGTEVQTANDHEWDALISALAARCGSQGEWVDDLFDGEDELITPAGQVHYWWPTDLSGNGSKRETDAGSIVGAAGGDRKGFQRSPKGGL